MIKIEPMEIKSTLVGALEDILSGPPHMQFTIRVKTVGTPLHEFVKDFMDYATDKLCIYLSDLNLEAEAAKANRE